MPSDNNFEIAFSDLAHASLSERAPGLNEYLVGFQILEKNDDDTRAIGLFGFKVGNQWFYAPVFFLGGAIKGMELLYVKNQDLFVPLQDNWVNYLISKQPKNLGQAETAEESELQLPGPDFQVFSESPGLGNKWASASDWVRPFAGMIKAAANWETKGDGITLGTALKSEPALAIPFVSAVRANPKLAEAVLQYHDFSDILPDPAKVKSAAIAYNNRVTEKYGRKARQTKQAAGNIGNNHEYGYARKYNTTEDVLASLLETRRSKQAAEGDLIEKGQESPSVEVYTQEDIPEVLASGGGSETLTDSEKEQLAKGEVVVRDHRDNSSKVYEAEFDKQLTNPTCTGVYDVLTAAGKFEKCFVAYEPKTIGQGTARHVVTVVSLERQAASNHRPIDVFTRNAEQGGGSFQDRLSEVTDKAKSLDSMKPGYLYMLVRSDGKVSMPFMYMRTVTGTAGEKQHLVKPKTRLLTSNRNGVMSELDYDFDSGPGFVLEDCADYDEVPYDSDEDTGSPYDQYDLSRAKVVFESPKSNIAGMRNVNKTTFIPAGEFKVLELGYDGRRSAANGAKELVAFNPGTLADAEVYITKAGAAELEVYRDGVEVILSSESGKRRMKSAEAVKTLVLDWGLRGDDAQHIVKTASRDLKQYFVKLAQPPYLNNAPGAPSIPAQTTGFDPYTQAITQDQMPPDLLPVPGMEADSSNEEAYNLMDDEEVQSILGAAQKGSKELFDTSVLKGLVKTVDVDALVDSFLPAMIRGMDHVGRTLFLFYWHNDSFRERYGRQDLVDLEDSLKNVFKSLGDLTLFLKQKTIDSEQMLESVDVELEDSAL